MLGDCLQLLQHCQPTAGNQTTGRGAGGGWAICHVRCWSLCAARPKLTAAGGAATAASWRSAMLSSCACCRCGRTACRANCWNTCAARLGWQPVMLPRLESAARPRRTCCWSRCARHWAASTSSAYAPTTTRAASRGLLSACCSMRQPSGAAWICQVGAPGCLLRPSGVCWCAPAVARGPTEQLLQYAAADAGLPNAVQRNCSKWHPLARGLLRWGQLLSVSLLPATLLAA